MERTDLKQFSVLLLERVKKFKYVLFLLGILVVGVLIFMSTQLLQEKNSQQETLPNTWELLLNYHTRSNTVSLQEINIKKGNAGSSLFTDSPYKILVYGKNNNILFQTYITIVEEVFYGLDVAEQVEDDASILLPQPENIPTIITIPYYANAEHVVITKNDEPIITITPPKNFSYSLLPQVVAQGVSPPSCGPMNVVFLSEGYSNMDKFHKDVDTLKAAMVSIEPYKSNQSMFDFKMIDNTRSFGCKKDGHLVSLCLQNGAVLNSVLDVVRTKYPEINANADFLKIVILVDGKPEPTDIQGVTYLGVAYGLGGHFSIFQTERDLTETAIHELNGHSVGKLYDRYVVDDPTYGKLTNGIRSNCTDNSTGESFWNDARSPNDTSKGCSNTILYAPVKTNCSKSGNMVSTGVKNSIMSETNCSEGRDFDAVEQAWIKNQIIAKYKACTTATGTPKPTSSPSSSSGETTTGTPSPTTASTSTANLICSPEGGVEKRYDSNKLTVENKKNKDVEIWYQYNYCDYKGAPLKDGEKCDIYLLRKTLTLKPNEKKTLVFNPILQGKIGVMNVNTVNPADGGCFRPDNGQQWIGGQGFAAKANPGTATTLLDEQKKKWITDVGTTLQQVGFPGFDDIPPPSDPTPTSSCIPQLQCKQSTSGFQVCSFRC